MGYEIKGGNQLVNIFKKRDLKQTYYDKFHERKNMIN